MTDFKVGIYKNPERTFKRAAMNRQEHYKKTKRTVEKFSNYKCWKKCKAMQILFRRTQKLIHRRI